MNETDERAYGVRALGTKANRGLGAAWGNQPENGGGQPGPILEALNGLHLAAALLAFYRC